MHCQNYARALELEEFIKPRKSILYFNWFFLTSAEMDERLYEAYIKLKNLSLTIVVLVERQNYRLVAWYQTNG